MDEFEIEVKKEPERSYADDIFAYLSGLEAKFKELAMQPKLVAGFSVAAFVLVLGTPHLGLNYRCAHRTTYSIPCREYVSCSYLGILGWQEIRPNAGEFCGVFKMMRHDWSRLLARG